MPTPLLPDDNYLYHDKLLPGAAVRFKLASAVSTVTTFFARGGDEGADRRARTRAAVALVLTTVACLAVLGAVSVTLLTFSRGGVDDNAFDGVRDVTKDVVPGVSTAGIHVRGGEMRHTGGGGKMAAANVGRSSRDNKGGGKREVRDEHGVLFKPAFGVLFTSSVERHVLILQVMGTHVFLRKATPLTLDESCPPVLLLHGAAYSSTLWQNLGTMSLLGHKTGCQSFAVDLPTGSADAGRLTEDADVAPFFRGDFLAALVQRISPTRPMVIVAPSMSGSYAIPLVISRPQLVAGFVPIAPVLEMSRNDRDKLKSSLVPTLAVCGEWDARGKQVTKTLLAPMPFAVVHVLPEARHAAYADQPEKFHKLLLEFVKTIAKGQ